MGYLATEAITQKLREIIQLNPFDAVAIVHLDDQRYTVEMVNTKATLLFEQPFTIGMDATQFFNEVHWSQISPFLQTPYEENQFVTLQNAKHLVVHVQPLLIEEQPLISIVMRLATNDLSQTFEAHHQDELTGLFNRRALNEQWAVYAESQQESNIALLLVDLDRFKRFNESLGKNKADGMLHEVSNRFNALRSDFCEVYRYNGDEFVFLVRYYAREEVEAIANEILRLLTESFVVDEQEYYITASIGISASVEGQCTELDTLLHRADQALFHVKNHGRSHFRFFRKEMSQTFPNEALMEAHFRRAIEFNELSIHFQPQINLLTNHIDSFEALIRWNNRKFGHVPPSQFIPIAESSELILEMGDWIIERVLQYQKEWRDLGYRPVRIAINISPKQFKQEQFVAKIEQLLKQYEIDPQYIELEITESSMTNVNETSSILHQLKQLGVFVSVDDFGTGYSSLSYLKTYPIDIIKIDQSFIADIAKDKKNEAIIKAIILLSHNLGLEVVAEGVEKKNQEQFLKDHNCEKVQGYLYNKPLPVEKVVEEYFLV